MRYKGNEAIRWCDIDVVKANVDSQAVSSIASKRVLVKAEVLRVGVDLVEERREGGRGIGSSFRIIRSQKSCLECI
ncbi:hypothetical protein BT96DRAFT_924462 [Gymnopus androsaceus JB14]|uniref:Uncharacterized protein n=1 Tax=Gymnopus androsaceus JB14 TaxID=1447944 RepID=A0A6A4H621_9AGAR|nr:hypothetical protein BT96DRAFT_924462 [Gymnopus androsaceus JB14]